MTRSNQFNMGESRDKDEQSGRETGQEAFQRGFHLHSKAGMNLNQKSKGNPGILPCFIPS